MYAQLLKLRIDEILNKPVRIALIFYPLWSGYGFCLFLAAVNFLVSTYFGSSLSEVVSDGLILIMIWIALMPCLWFWLLLNDSLDQDFCVKLPIYWILVFMFMILPSMSPHAIEAGFMRAAGYHPAPGGFHLPASHTGK